MNYFIPIPENIANFVANRAYVRFDYIRKAFCFILSREIANFQNRGIKQSKTLMLACIHLARGLIYRHGVGWTVYFDLGVWRCLLEDKPTLSHAFFIHPKPKADGRGYPEASMFMKRLFLIVGVFFATLAVELHAQDIIVLRDGSLIQSKVSEVLPAEIKYRKFSNPTGPLYTIEKSTVLAINYENGEKESYADYTAPAPQKNEAAPAPTGPQKIEVPTAANNAELIAKYNEPLNYKPMKKPSTKPAKYMFVKFGITKNSVLSNEEIEVSIDWEGKSSNHWCCSHVIYIKNKTDNTIYIDLGNTFRIKDEKSHIYFDNSEQTTVTHGNASGGSIGLGSVTNALGIGGVVGTLAGGVTVGGGNRSGIQTTYTNQRILVIPPHSRKALSKHKDVEVEATGLLSGEKRKVISHGEEFACSHLQKLVKDYGITEFNETSSPEKWKYIITYSTKENFQTYSMLSFEVFSQQIFGSRILFKIARWGGVKAFPIERSHEHILQKYRFLRRSYLIIGYGW